VKGKFAEAFEVELAELACDERYRELTWLKEPVERLHNGYFAQDRKGVLKDTRGDTWADDEVYNLIMKEKERLLPIEEPLRFIFSHSAPREGWDNPNVFQICTLNETRSAVKKRQEIGRGLRLPVDQSGLRVFDESVNKLYVMANESYEDFAKALQTEYEEDCGVTFGKVPLTQTWPRLTLLVKSGWSISDATGGSFTRGSYSVSLAFKRHMQDRFFELTNRVTTSFTSVGNSADSPETILRPSPATSYDADILEA